jgi:TPR repeat protein
VYSYQDGEQALRAGAHREAFEIFLILARNAEVEAMYRLSEMIINKQVTEAQAQQVFELLVEQSQSRNADATFNLAIVYWGAPFASIQSLDKAVETFMEACRMLFPRAFIGLARLCMTSGSGLAISTPANIMRLLRRGLELGCAEAAQMLAKQYLDGQMVEKNDDEAYMYLFIAGKLGDPEARKQALMMEGLYPRGAFLGAQERGEKLLMGLQEKGVLFS